MTRSDIELGLEGLGAKVMKELDFDRNGRLEFTEFLLANLDFSEVLRDDKLKVIFDMIDGDKCGELS